MDRNVGPAELVEALASTEACLEAVGARLSATRLASAPDAGAWSANEILWHIRATADVYGEHIDRILNEDRPTWRHVSPRARMKKSRYDEQPFAESFAAFATQRAALVSRLGALPPEAWMRTAIVKTGAKQSPLALRERVWGMVTHEQVHCQQIQALG